MANRLHLLLLKQSMKTQSIDTWNQWREEHADVRPNLSGANLNVTDLLKTNILQQQLNQVKSCKGALLPPGLACHNQ